MESALRVTPAELQRTAASFGARGKNMAAAMEDMMAKVNALKGKYEGEAADAYIRTFNGLQDDISKINAKIQEHVSDLNQIAENFSRTETELEGKNAALPNNPLA